MNPRTDFKRRYAAELCGEMDRDLWGRPYKFVMNKLRSAYKASTTCQGLLRRIITDLFSFQPDGGLIEIECDVSCIRPVTKEGTI